MHECGMYLWLCHVRQYECASEQTAFLVGRYIVCLCAHAFGKHMHE
jgi:hypothetical protein